VYPPGGTPKAEYLLNVSWLELLAEWLPQALLDNTILMDYDQLASLTPKALDFNAAAEGDAPGVARAPLRVGEGKERRKENGQGDRAESRTDRAIEKESQQSPFLLFLLAPFPFFLLLDNKYQSIAM